MQAKCPGRWTNLYYIYSKRLPGLFYLEEAKSAQRKREVAMRVKSNTIFHREKILERIFYYTLVTIIMGAALLEIFTL